MTFSKRLLAIVGAALVAGAVHAAHHELMRSAAPDNATAYIVSPRDGATVPSTFKVVFGLSGMGVAPAGVDAPNTGHHHLIIDTALASMDEPVPSDDNHRHFGKGQTETMLTLAPGTHTLQLVLGDARHVPHDPVVASEVITVTVAD